MQPGLFASHFWATLARPQIQIVRFVAAPNTRDLRNVDGRYDIADWPVLSDGSSKQPSATLLVLTVMLFIGNDAILVAWAQG